MKPTPWEVVSCVIVALAVIVALSYAPPVPELSFRDPAIDLPGDLESVIGYYPMRGPKLERVRVQFQAYPDGLEYWIEDDGTGGAGEGMGRPYRWAYPEEAERMELPEVPDLLLKAMVERRFK